MEVRQFLGLCSYYRRFVANFAEIARARVLLQAERGISCTDVCP